MILPVNTLPAGRRRSIRAKRLSCAIAYDRRTVPGRIAQSATNAPHENFLTPGLGRGLWCLTPARYGASFSPSGKAKGLYLHSQNASFCSGGIGAVDRRRSARCGTGGSVLLPWDEGVSPRMALPGFLPSPGGSPVPTVFRISFFSCSGSRPSGPASWAPAGRTVAEPSAQRAGLRCGRPGPRSVGRPPAAARHA